MADVAQLVRALDCGSGGRGFEPHHSPHIRAVALFLFDKKRKICYNLVINLPTRRKRKWQKDFTQYQN